MGVLPERRRRGSLTRERSDIAMVGWTEEGPRYETRFCPRCGAELYADMSVCYGCLYDFSREPPSPRELGLPELGEAPARDGEGDTVDLSEAALVAHLARDEAGMVVRTPFADVWVGVGEEGLTIGRSPENDLVLHVPAVSRRHLRVTPTSDGMEVCDLGATNPARYHGEEVRGRVIVPYGESVDVCGCALTMTGLPGKKSLTPMGSLV